MAQTIKLKRSSTGGAVPSTSSLSLGEVAINTYDGKMYIKKNDGSDAIVEIGAGNGEAVWNSYDYTATSSQTSFSGSDNNSETLSYVPNFLQVFLNGILLDPAVDYAATTGNSIVLTVGASTSDLIQIETFTQIIGTGDILVDTFPVSSTQTAFTLSQDPINKSNISVYVEGVYQESSTYSLSTTTLTLSESPANGTTVEVVIGTRNVTLDGIVDLTISGTLHAGALDLGDANIINVNEISLDTIKGDADANTNITFAGNDVTTFTQGGTERLRLNTTGAEITGNIVVSGTVDGRDVAADGVTADAALSRAGGAMGGAITTNSTFDGRDVSVDGTKLDGIESGATADQTDVEIRAAVESASDSNVFTNADHNKLNAIEASADVTDATNVTAAGALMDSEVTNLAQVKAFDSSDYATAAQGTTANAALPKAGGTMTGALVINSGTANTGLSITSTDAASWLTMTDPTASLFFGNTAGNYALYTGGTESMKVDTTGKLSIGGATPQGNLTIKGAASDDIDLLTFSEDGTNQSFSFNGNFAGSGSTGNNLTLDSYWTNDIMAWTGDGNVGIGTSTPAAKLNVYTDAGRDFRVDHGTANRTILSTDRGMIVKAAGGYSLELDTGSDTGSILFKDNGVTHSQFNASGNLALGTTTHLTTGGAAKLSVAGILAIGVSNADMSYIRRQSAGNYAWQTYDNNNTGSIQLQPYGGNVGIGTDSPAHKLSIEGGAATVIQMAHGSSAVYNWALAAQYITTNAFEIVPSTVVGGSVFTTPVATFKSTGNVGIGTTSPTYKLETKDGDISVVKLEAAAGGNAVNGIRFRVLNSANTAQSATLGMINAETVNSWGGVLTFSTKPANATPNEAVTERMRIDAAGKVGIGTTNPPAEGLTIRREGSDKQTLLQLDRPNTAGLQTNIKFSVADIMVGQIQHEYASANYNHMSFTLRSPSGADVIPLWLENSGNVGIGTTSPDFKLDIEGSGTPTLAVRNSSTSSNSQIHIGEQNTTAYGVDIRYEGNLGNVFFDNHYAHATRPHMYFRMQTAGTAINALTINPVGNVGIGTGVPTATLDVAGTALVENAKLKAIAESNTDTAADVFVYDTRKDSDGGAWRKRTQNTSWYNEALNTSTRGARKEFPSVAVIVADNSADKITIYDGDDPDMPMWMVFQVANGKMLGEGDVTAIAALNGIISVACGGNGYDFYTANIIEDTGYQWFTAEYKRFYSNVATRNVGASASDVNASFFLLATIGLRSRKCNDVAMTVLPNAPINADTGLPVPTIAVATDGGVSIIKDNGTIVDITNGQDSSAFNYIDNLFFRKDGALVWAGDSSTNTAAERFVQVLHNLPNADTNQGSVEGSSVIDEQYGPSHKTGSKLRWATTAGVKATSDAGENFAVGTSGALHLIKYNREVEQEGSIAHITSDYNTGYMLGDIKLATLSDTSTTNVTGGTQPDRSYNNNALNVTGTITKTAVATGAELVGYSGLSTSNYL